MATFRNVTVLGTGVLGAQIAFQTANHGLDVQAFDVTDEAIDAGRERLRSVVEQYLQDVGEDRRESAEEAVSRISFGSVLADAVQHADLVIEAIPENLELKRKVYGQLADVAPQHTIFATNSSTLLPSDLAASTGRPDRFLALHFANHIWRQNTAEIMGTEQTSPEVYAQVVTFAEDIGMVPIQLHKEQPGYVLNSLLVPLLNAAAGLVLTGVTDPHTVDTTWRIATGAPLGPFQIYDVVGLRTAHAIASANPEAGSQAWAAYLKTNYIDQGKLGVESGEGFYSYR